MGLCLSTNENGAQIDSPSYGGNEVNKSRSQVSSSPKPSPRRTDGEIRESSNLVIFCYNLLKEATHDFSSNAFLGSGKFGSVFKGWIDVDTLKATSPGKGTAIAVKMLNQKGGQGQQEWLAEIKYLGRLSHPNFVKLIGYCLEDEHRLLVYEFMPSGSLDKVLFSGDSLVQAVSWDALMKIALGAAKALAFLHKVEAIYRDFKTSDILLDAKYNAKLSDFGVTRDGPTGSKSHVSTRVLGTEGYASPEYIRTGHLNSRSDVYSFGIVLLEMISGREAIERNKPSEEQNLGNWARRARNISQVLNPAILGDNSGSDMIKVAKLALKCVSVEPKCRPSMKEVVEYLEKVQILKVTERCRGSKHCNRNNSSKYGRKKLH